jgi:hypothetical protein
MIVVAFLGGVVMGLVLAWSALLFLFADRVPKRELF